MPDKEGNAVTSSRSSCAVCSHLPSEHNYDCATCASEDIRGSCAVSACDCYWYLAIEDLCETEDMHAEQYRGFLDGTLTRTGRQRKQKIPSMKRGLPS